MNKIPNQLDQVIQGLGKGGNTTNYTINISVDGQRGSAIGSTAGNVVLSLEDVLRQTKQLSFIKG